MRTSDKIGLYATAGVLAGGYSFLANGLGTLFLHYKINHATRTSMSVSAGIFALQCMAMMPILKCYFDKNKINNQKQFLYSQGVLFIGVMATLLLDNLIVWSLMMGARVDGWSLKESVCAGTLGAGLLTAGVTLCGIFGFGYDFADFDASQTSINLANLPDHTCYIELEDFSPQPGSS